MSTVGDVIAYNLSLDANNVIGDAVTIYNNNTTVFASSGNVPAWLYTPLWSILGCASSNLSTRIIANYGETKIPTGPCIVIQPTEQSEASIVRSGNMSSQPGARTCKIDIFVKNVVTDKDVTLVNNALNRITYLIDFFCRENRSIPEYVDLTIPDNISGFYQSPFRCQLECTYLPIASEGYSTFRVDYYLTFV